ncbi:MAG: M1 family metallopeptidase [Saprospiraceae bacterium]
MLTKLSTKFSIIILFISSNILFAQNKSFSQKDSLRGSLRPERAYDVSHYELHINVNIDKKFISGYNIISFKGQGHSEEMQIDLFDNMKIKSIKKGSKEIKYRRISNAVFISNPIKENQTDKIKIEFEGNPIVAKNAPWDGGFVWTQDDNKNPWVGVACEGIGASLWWPNKDHLSDEPENMDIYLTVAKPYMGISNGHLVEQTNEGKKQTTFHWQVSYPINNYNVTLYIGKYANFSEELTTLSGEKLKLNYYVLEQNLEKAKTHFTQTAKMLESFDYYLGTFPFIKDGYALVEAPYLGMEHQSAIAYGNKYQRGYLGSRIPKDLNFDYIILHESGHEYWGNSVSCTDYADIWLHEGFTTYMESLYIEHLFGKEAGLNYLESQRALIKNDQPILGPKGVNYTDQSTDIYYKGAWVLQTLRQSLLNDTLWFQMFKGFYNEHKLGFATTKDFVDYVSLKSGRDYAPFLRQYLKYKPIPKLMYSISHRDTYTNIKYKWDCLEQEFYLPVEFDMDGKKIILEPGANWKNIEFNRNFKSVKPKVRGLLIDVEEVKS